MHMAHGIAAHMECECALCWGWSGIHTNFGAMVDHVLTCWTNWLESHALSHYAIPRFHIAVHSFPEDGMLFTELYIPWHSFFGLSERGNNLSQILIAWMGSKNAGLSCDHVRDMWCGVAMLQWGKCESSSSTMYSILSQCLSVCHKKLLGLTSTNSLCLTSSCWAKWCMFLLVIVLWLCLGPELCRSLATATATHVWFLLLERSNVVSFCRF